MSKSMDLRARDGRAIINLVGECRELGDDWRAWQEHWIAGLLELTDADLGFSGEVADTHGLRFRMLSPPVILGRPGFPTNHARIMEAIECYTAVPGMSAFVGKYIEAMLVEDGVALRNRDFYQDREWRATFDMQTAGEAYGTDPTLLCMRLMPRINRDESLNATLNRAKGRRNFSARDCTVVREAIAAIAPLIGGPLARFSDPSPADLAPRARQVLACLLEGDSDKQIAARLGLSTHTVNQYTKAIFQHFGTRSRAELLARWIRRGWGDRFPWVD